MSVLVIADERPKARIEHRCQMCYRTIRPGEVYRRQRNIYDGDAPYVWKECVHCEALVTITDIDSGWWDEGISEESISEWEPDTIRDLRWKAQWKRKWTRRDGDLYPVPVVTA